MFKSKTYFNYFIESKTTLEILLIYSQCLTTNLLLSKPSSAPKPSSDSLCKQIMHIVVGFFFLEQTHSIASSIKHAHNHNIQTHFNGEDRGLLRASTEAEEVSSCDKQTESITIQQKHSTQITGRREYTSNVCF